MARLVRMDRTGHTTLAEWAADDPASLVRAEGALKAELEQGYLAVRSDPGRPAEQVRVLPVDASLVVLRRPIAGG